MKIFLIVFIAFQLLYVGYLIGKISMRKYYKDLYEGIIKSYEKDLGQAIKTLDVTIKVIEHLKGGSYRKK